MALMWCGEAVPSSPSYQILHTTFSFLFLSQVAQIMIINLFVCNT